MRTDYSAMNDHASAWLVVNTHPHREKLALVNLCRQNFSAYCPRIRKRLRSRYGSADVLRPLFPGYLFVRVDRSSSLWRPILSTHGVRRVVRFGDSVNYLDNQFVESLRAREVDGAIVKPQAAYVVGQEIKLAGGPFDGIVAKIIEVQEKDRLVILMNLLSQPVRTMVNADQVFPFAAT
jgi:transcriptional antiterminator RfaH